MTTMTVAQLREALASASPDSVVVLDCEHDGSVRFSHPVNGVYLHGSAYGFSITSLSGSFGQTKDLDGFAEEDEDEFVPMCDGNHDSLGPDGGCESCWLDGK